MKILNSQKGFTLIELLVVVSIIALLAAIVVAGLTDARGGAKNNKRNELARQYVTALGLYHGEYGSYPESSVDKTVNVCLGEGNISDGEGDCYVWGGHDENVQVNTQISEFIPGKPASLESTIAGGHNFRGISYKCTDVNCLNYELSWVVEGSGSDADCFGGATRQTLNDTIAICKYTTAQ